MRRRYVPVVERQGTEALSGVGAARSREAGFARPDSRQSGKPVRRVAVASERGYHPGGADGHATTAVRVRFVGEGPARHGEIRRRFRRCLGPDSALGAALRQVEPLIRPDDMASMQAYRSVSRGSSAAAPPSGGFHADHGTATSTVHPRSSSWIRSPVDSLSDGVNRRRHAHAERKPQRPQQPAEPDPAALGQRHVRTGPLRRSDHTVNSTLLNVMSTIPFFGWTGTGPTSLQNVRWPAGRCNPRIRPKRRERRADTPAA